MVSDEIYDLCLQILEDPNIDEDDQAEKLTELVQRELSLTGDPLEKTVLDILWRFREPTSSSVSSPPVRHYNIIRRNSPAPWHSQRITTTAASPSLSRVGPALPPGLSPRPGFLRSKSYGTGSNFSSPRPSPRLAFATPIPHSPSLDSYGFSAPSVEQNEYGDYGSDTVDWLVNEGSTSRPSSSGAGSASESGLNAAAASWSYPSQNEMSPYDMLRSVMGDGKTDEEIEAALEANGYDLSATIMNFMGNTTPYPQEQQSYFPENDGQVLIGKSMNSSQPIMIDQDRGRSNIVCKYWLSNGNCLRADCRFSHDLSSHICKYAYVSELLCTLLMIQVLGDGQLPCRRLMHLLPRSSSPHESHESGRRNGWDGATANAPELSSPGLRYFSNPSAFTNEPVDPGIFTRPIAVVQLFDFTELQ